MAKKDHKEIDLEIIPLVLKLNDYVEEVEGKINDLEGKINVSTKSDDKVKALRVRIEAMKKTQEDVDQRFNAFIFKNFLRDNQLNLEFDFEEVKAGIEEFKKVEENVERRLNGLLRIYIHKTLTNGEEQYVDDAIAACGEEKSCEFLGAKGIKIPEDYFNNEEAPGYNSSGQGSVDLEKIPGFASSEDLGVWTNIEGREPKMYALVLKGKDLLKKDEDDLNTSLIEWIKTSSDEGEALTAVKDRAVKLGTELSFLLVDLVFITSEREEWPAIFEKFKSLLGTVFKDERFMVVNKIIAVLEIMTDGEMKELSKVTKESMEGSSRTMEDTELDMNELREGLVEESQIDKLLIQILEAVVRLEYMLMHPRLPHLKMSKKEDVKAGLKQYEEDLKGVEMKINELKKSFFSIFGSEYIHRVIPFWNHFFPSSVLESFEEKEPRSN